MTMLIHTRTAFDRLAANLLAGLDREFGRGAGEGLAAYYLAAEECDFLWEARQCERWLGACESEDGDDRDLDRVAIMGLIAGRWFAATMIIDGNGEAQNLLGRHDFESRKAARDAFDQAH